MTTAKLHITLPWNAFPLLWKFVIDKAPLDPRYLLAELAERLEFGGDTVLSEADLLSVFKAAHDRWRSDLDRLVPVWLTAAEWSDVLIAVKAAGFEPLRERIEDKTSRTWRWS